MLAKRWVLIMAIMYVVASAVGLFVLPAAPNVSAGGDELVAYVVKNADSLRVVGWFATLSIIPFVLLAAATRQRLTGVGRDVMFIGATAIALMTTIWTWTALGLALDAGSLAPATARTVTDIAAFYGPTLTVMVILFVAPVGVAAFRGTGGLPRWLGWVTAVLVVEQAIESITVLGTSGFIAPGGDMNLVLGAGLYLVWIVCCGVAVSTTPDAGDELSPGV